MKKLTLVVVIALFATVQIFANGKNPNKNINEKLRNEIAVLLDEPAIVIETASVEASIEFTVNAKNEIVILIVNSEKVGIESYVKARLNYKKVNFDSSKTENKVFKMNLKVLRPI